MRNPISKKALHREQTLGIALSRDQFTLARVTWDSGVPSLESCTRVRILNQTPEKALREYIRKQGWQNAQAHVVADDCDYELFLTERPAVSSAELRDALRWPAQELLDDPEGGVVVDALPLARDAFRDGEQMVFCAAMPHSVMNAIVKTLVSAKLGVASLDTQEGALRNLAILAGCEGQNVVAVQVDSLGCRMLAIRGRELLACRQFEPGLAWQVTRLAIEIQRFIDYFETQMNRGVVDCIRLLPHSEPNIADIQPGLASQFAVPVQSLTLQQFFTNIPDRLELPEFFRSDCLHAIGAALRGNQRLAEVELIDLHQPQIEDTQGRPQWRHAFFGLGLVLGGVIVDGYLTTDRLGDMQARAAVAKQELLQIEEAHRNLELSTKGFEADPELPGKIARQQEGNRQLKHVSERVRAMIQDDKSGFSTSLHALAESHVEGAWLREISLQRGGGKIMLKGAANSPDVLLSYLDSLGKNAHFAGKEFASLDIKLDSESGKLTFTLASDQAEDAEQ